MIRSVSQSSLRTVGTLHSDSRVVPVKVKQSTRGQWLWEGRVGNITNSIAMLPWSTCWQMTVILQVIYKYCVHFLLGYDMVNSNLLLEVTLLICEFVYIADVIIVLHHQFWPVLRAHVRVYRQSYILVAYDVISIVPINVIASYCQSRIVTLLGRWLVIGRIYRLIRFFNDLNNTMRTSRLKLHFLEHSVLTALILHGLTCIWYYLNIADVDTKEWYKLGYPSDLTTRRVVFDSYATCWYYCACRVFNCIFGDGYPSGVWQKWFTTFVMVFGYVFVRYRFIGYLAWELTLQKRRWATFSETYHHVIDYLEFREAPSSLIEQTKLYKKHLWRMKDGILTTDYLHKLPLPLQMELIFDINVGHFHDSLLLRDTGEAFMRHISLLIKHELYLEGQHVWSQGVVKGGMVFIKRGVVEMLSDEDDESPVISFKEGTVLGEISLFYSIPSKVTVKAATYVELQVYQQVLQRTDFMRAMSEYPRILQIIQEKVERRISSSKRKEAAIRTNDKNDSSLLRMRYRPMKTLKDQLSGVEEEDSAFIDDAHMFYKDENNVKRPKFTTEYLELYKISKNVSSIDTPRICLTGTFPWILEPDTTLTFMFDLVHFATVLYVCVMLPQSAIELTPTDWQKVFDSVVYTSLLLNIYIQLTTAIEIKNVKKVTIREIAQEKMATIGFYLDVLSIFPLYIFTDTLDPQTESFTSLVVMLLPVLQVWHIWDYLQQWENSFERNFKVLCLIKFTLIFLIFCYWSGCFLYIVACPKKLCQEGSWMARIIYWETKVLLTNDPKHERPMVTSLSFGTSVFTCSGAAEIAPGTRDFFVVIILFILGTYLASFYSAKVCSLYLLSTQRKLEFKESMRELFYFLSVNHVSSKIKARVEKFFCVQWYYNEAVSYDEIFKDMSPNIQQEILSLDMIETLLICPLFQNCSRDFLQTVATNTKTIVLPYNETIQHACDIGRDMFIVKMGHCNNLDHTGKVVSVFGPGSVIGVIEMLYGLPKVYTVVTTTNCILLHVEYTALVQCWSLFPDTSNPIFEALQDPETRRQALRYENGKPLVGQIDAKTNRIAKEIKESIVVINSVEFSEAFEALGILKYLRYLFFPGCITPHGLFLKCWCVVRFVTAIYYVVIIPYNIATKQSRFGAGYNWCDIILYIDIMVMSYVAYYNEKSLLITHPLLTVTRYLRHGFLLDIITVFPFEEFCKIIMEHSDTDLYRLNRILLVTRVIGAFMYWEGDIMRLNQVVVMMKFLPVALVIVNFVSCFVFANSCVPINLKGGFLLVNCTRSLIVSAVSYEIKYAVYEYTNTFYWVFEIFVGCGCTPMSVFNKWDVYLTMGLQVAGVVYFAFMFGYIASTRSAASHDLLEHNENTKDLADFLYQENVDLVLTVKTLNYFKYVWKRTHGSDPQKICRGLNSALMEDTLVFMYERALREVPLFGKVERSFIRVITQHLHEMYFLKGDTVVQCKDVQTYIYIIYRGKVDVLSSYNEMLTCMGPGGMFGNFTGQPLSCSQVSIYASRSLDLLVIPSQTFFNLIKYYPKVQDLLYNALDMSRDYILPITVDNFGDDSVEDVDFDAESDDSEFESRSASNKFDPTSSPLSGTQSKSNISQAKSAASTITTSSSYLDMENLIRPGSRLFQAQGYFTCFMAAINYILLSYEVVTLNDCPAIFWVQGVIDVFFYIRVYFLIHEGYINKQGYLIVNPVKCRRRYYSHKLWVWLDIIANFPLELFGFCFASPLSAMHHFRGNKLFRFKYMIQFYRNTSKELTNNLTVLQTVMTALVVLILLHTFACVWLLLLTVTEPVCVIRTLKLDLVNTDDPNRKWDYTTSMYVVVAELTSTGGDEYIMKKIFSMCILALCFTCGKILAATVVATSMQIAHFTKYALNAYELVTIEVMDFLNNQGLSSYQSKKFWKYIQMLWATDRGRQLPELIFKTPYVLRCDIMSAMFGQYLRSCYLFADTSAAFQRQLTVLMEYTVFFPGNYVVVAGDSEARMYWVESGVVSVVSVRADLTETTHELLHAGDVFGVTQGLNRGIPHCFSYRAKSKVAILSLSLDSWMNIMQFFPEEKRLITSKSEILFTRI